MPGPGDRFIMFITRTYINLQQAAQAYNPVAKPGDIVDVGDNITGLAAQRQAIPTPGNYQVELVSAETGVSSAQQAKAAGATMMGWDLESGAGYTPQNELNNIPSYAASYSRAAHAAGMQFAIAPSATIATQYAKTIAAYCDMINLQGEATMGTSAYLQYYSLVVPQIRAVNPNCRIVGEVSVNRGELSMTAIQQAWSSIAHLVDGVTCWVGPTTLTQAGQFYQWFRANY